ncbi:hypothetical protein [Pontibacillus marinus]|uniref:Uncharacterized protein n=1 Tax=Pontibacillus marinus BH030004 = DSM 16465 TaxID=1385511 RepID=A0A0A5FZC9_9BACI|nr:hypothetical protein [Pontibacillus marinus]KGX84198.1 hypothetical protein N783_18820 [Pontibacillus marinus BH030004 = DSM 16465]
MSFLVNGLWALVLFVTFTYFVIKDVRKKKKKNGHVQPPFDPEVEKEKNRHVPPIPMDGGST